MTSISACMVLLVSSAVLPGARCVWPIGTSRCFGDTNIHHLVQVVDASVGAQTRLLEDVARIVDAAIDRHSGHQVQQRHQSGRDVP